MSKLPVIGEQQSPFRIAVKTTHRIESPLPYQTLGRQKLHNGRSTLGVRNRGHVACRLVEKKIQFFRLPPGR